MEAARWSAIALTATLSMGTLYLLVARLDGIAARIDGLSSRVDAQGQSLGGRIDALAATMAAGFDRVDDRLAQFERRLDAHVGRHAG